MADSELRTRQIQQIPVFALRQAVANLVGGQTPETILRERMRTVLNLRPRKLKRAIHRLSREQLTRLVNACPEIEDAQVQELFEEYRYGANPSFYIYLFNPNQLQLPVLELFRSGFEAALHIFNQELEENLPRLRRIELNDLIILANRPEIIEGTYRFQARLDYIDEDQNVISTYQTLYSFFWLNTVMGYSIIQARSTEILQGLVRAMQAGAGVAIYPLVISKQFKNALPFLRRAAFRSGRLHDPNPESKRFRWLTIADDQPYEKGYEEYELNYPEVTSARYRELVDEDRETTLTIRCDQGAFSLAGKLRASQFRVWCLDRLGKLVEVLNGYRADLTGFVQTQQLATAPELIRYTPEQKGMITTLIAALLTLKQAPEIGQQLVELGALALAAALGEYVQVQVPLECSEPGCEEEAYLACAECGATLFRLHQQDGGWVLKCARRHAKPQNFILPLHIETELGHEFLINEGELSRIIEVLPGKDLLFDISAAVGRRLPGFSFNQTVESFMIRGSQLIYYAEAPVKISESRNVFFVHQEIGTIAGGGSVTGVKIGSEVHE